ncbi:RagB/SusD family nutrient uptake outer membrane protein [Tenacibaculum maritimum]|uniref:RagB/SusD family nutrient uptake outer membrane protein n=1 Tax=Tenacibaculum maritimum TaxID=107401 RepID=UPI0012E6BE1F|nr:RagB/SusD family nutrient uptake outer membrane protein [Tenacibaculum maritimum]MCD9580679.1 RagB/SusD family nutrient uptake outer membrane protein [Tenacibaculum maritimum]MCD9634830.1 RagB/SusD family nutrient uptake outer membrane protein [Tenacibaculum maritimum]CAA0151098.1 SusD/RagB family lipoprotein precursor [Tenacibaculum maritimum]CAA0213583.1 SusD/RagB family lipoprotein precursor [Tenacibaculum maritimum]CAA0221988.1 SusD/RagB family lipoprotein precursor [Tenacibaculum marit
MKQLLSLFCVLFFTGCSLDFPVEDEITGIETIDAIEIANEALSSVYRAFPKNNRINFSKLVDDFYPNHTIDDNLTDYRLYKWEKRELILLSDQLWRNYYKTVMNANVLLGRISTISIVVKKEEKELKYIEAQTLCLKAYAFFELVQLYAPTYTEATKNELGIILKNKIISEELPRSTLEMSFRAIEILLLKAIRLFPRESNTIFRFSKRSAKALLAKVYLNWSKYGKAIELCDELLAISSINELSFAKMWKNIENQEEVLLALESTSSYFSDIYDQEMNEDEYYVNPLITYDSNDVRKASSLLKRAFTLLDNSIIEANFLGKYRTEIADTAIKPIAAIRMAEVYFIKAECLYKQNKEIASKEVLNNFLLLRRAKEINVTGTAFFKQLLKEKQKEFIGEGLRYFDIKRNDQVVERVNYKMNTAIFKILPSDFRWQFPIPAVEIKENKYAKQNSAW